MNKTKELKSTSVTIKSSSFTYPLSRNDLVNSSFSDDQDKPDFFSDSDLLDSLDNYQITIEAFQARVESEVVKILIEIYNNKIGSDQSPLSASIQRFQSEVEYFTVKYNLQFSVYILQLLAEKLVDLVHRCKLKLNTDVLYQDLKTISSIKNKFDIEKANNFLLGMNSIKQALAKSSKDITEVFRSPIDTIQTFSINIEEIIKELFYKEFIQEDDIIYNLISNLKYYENGKERKEAKGSNLALIEEEKLEQEQFNQTELDKFNKYLRQLETEKFDDRDEDEEEDIIEKTSNENDEEYKCASLDIDELVLYINTKDVDHKPKKARKKNKKKKKENSDIAEIDTIQTNSKGSSIVTKSNKTNESMHDYKKKDIEIELFKENITRTSTCAFTHHKIRPIISKEWLVKIERLMN